MTKQLIDRRTLLTGTSAALLSLPSLVRADGEYGIFKMGIQSYSLRHFPIDEALKLTHDIGLKIAERYGLSVYDAMIVASALLAGCKTVLSEDMQDGQVLEGRLRIRNPFR